MANDWREHDAPALGPKEYGAILQPDAIGFTIDGEFECWFDTVDVFAGHGITVYWDIEDGLDQVVMQ